MRRIRSTLREHWHFLIIVTLLTLVTTFPTIVYVFKTDVFWHPGGAERDVYIAFWDVWYGEQFLAGQASPFYTDQIFYPEGLSLEFHPFFIPHIIAVNALNIFLPLSNAFSLAYLMIIFLCALPAYVYLHWLFKERWIALLGAVIFALSPQVVGHPFHPQIAFITTIPLAIYFFERGIAENRPVLVLIAGLLTGLTTIIGLYNYICLLIMLGFFTIALAVARYRDKRFWFNIALLIASVTLSSLWRVYPLLTSSDSLSEAANWHGDAELATDAISYLVNHEHPVLGPTLESILGTPDRANVSFTSYLGLLPLLLIAIALFKSEERRQVMCWAGLCGLFLFLRLGSHLTVNGAVYSNIPLPKYFLNQLLPEVFVSFWEVDHFMMGALLPLAVLVCFGLVALQKRFPLAAKPGFVLALTLIVAFEYHIPVETERIFPEGDGKISQERLAFLDWLEQENGEVRLINLPTGRRNSKVYNLYQALSGYPRVEGAISRTPESAYDYIRANLLLNSWHDKLPISCRTIDRDKYLAELARLQADGFSHVVFHLGFKYADRIMDSFRAFEPSYADEFVWIFRLSELQSGCVGESSANYSFARIFSDALSEPSSLGERHGAAVVFAPSIPAADHFRRDLRYFTQIDRNIVTITSDADANIHIQSSAFPGLDARADLSAQAALWLVNSPQHFNAEQRPAFQGWFSERFHFCQRAEELDGITFDLYLRADLPCSAMDDSSALEVEYDGGARLHNASYAVNEDLLHFYLAWTNATTESYGFSLQFFDESGHKALQYDNVINRQLLAIHEIDTSSLPEGAYSVQLIAYSYETRKSLGGRVIKTGQSFERALEIARIEV